MTQPRGAAAPPWRAVVADCTGRAPVITSPVRVVVPLPVALRAG